MAQSPSEFPRRDDRGNESVIDPHARFNGKYVSDRDLRIEGEAQGEIECQGTLIISPQARVRSAIKAHNVIVNGDYEGDVDCGGRFEIGSTGRVKGNIKTQVLVVKEGAHWEGGVTMTREPGARPTAPAPTPAQQPAPIRRQAPAALAAASSARASATARGAARRAARGPAGRTGRPGARPSRRPLAPVPVSGAIAAAIGLGAAGAGRGHAGRPRRVRPSRLDRRRRARRLARRVGRRSRPVRLHCARAPSRSSSHHSSPRGASTSTASGPMRWRSWPPATGRGPPRPPRPGGPAPRRTDELRPSEPGSRPVRHRDGAAPPPRRREADRAARQLLRQARRDGAVREGIGLADRHATGSLSIPSSASPSRRSPR